MSGLKVEWRHDKARPCLACSALAVNIPDQAIEGFSRETDGKSLSAFANNAHTATLLAPRNKRSAPSREQRWSITFTFPM